MMRLCDNWLKTFVLFGLSLRVLVKELVLQFSRLGEACLQLSFCCCRILSRARRICVAKFIKKITESAITTMPTLYTMLVLTYKSA